MATVVKKLRRPRVHETTKLPRSFFDELNLREMLRDLDEMVDAATDPVFKGLVGEARKKLEAAHAVLLTRRKHG